VHAVERHRLVAAAAVEVRGRAGRRDAAAVERDGLVFARVVEQHESIAAQAAFHRQHDAFSGRHGDGRVECIAAALKNARADESGDGMGGTDHAARAESLGAALDAGGFCGAEAPGAVVCLHVGPRCGGAFAARPKDIKVRRAPVRGGYR
jgi:hypothetical protein